MHDIKESDWKMFKPLREQALERFCGRVLDEVARIGSDQTKSRHERHVAIYQLTRERDKEIEQIFDTLRRSTAVIQICSLRLQGLLTDDEVRQFSPEIVNEVEHFVRYHEETDRLAGNHTQQGVTRPMEGDSRPHRSALTRKLSNATSAARHSPAETIRADSPIASSSNPNSSGAKA